MTSCGFFGRTLGGCLFLLRLQINCWVQLCILERFIVFWYFCMFFCFIHIISAWVLAVRDCHTMGLLFTFVLYAMKWLWGKSEVQAWKTGLSSPLCALIAPCTQGPFQGGTLMVTSTFCDLCYLWFDFGVFLIYLKFLCACFVMFYLHELFINT